MAIIRRGPRGAPTRYRISPEFLESQDDVRVHFEDPMTILRPKLLEFLQQQVERIWQPENKATDRTDHRMLEHEKCFASLNSARNRGGGWG
jgi:hypothetical protein